MERVAVVGCIGAGKSTLARTLGTALGLPVIHLDRHWWSEGEYVITGRRTVEARTMPRDEYHQFQEQSAAGDRWVIDGGADGIDLRLARADTAVFLDLPAPICAWRVIRRTGRTRPDYPPHVRESWRWAILLIRWILWTYPRHRREAILQAFDRHRDHLTVAHLHSRAEVASFVASTVRSPPPTGVTT